MSQNRWIKKGWKFWLIPFLLVLSGISLLIIIYLEEQTNTSDTEIKLPNPSTFSSTNEMQLWEFVATHMSDQNGGIYTNLRSTQDEKINADIATGHTVLSESIGLLLDYAVQSHNQKLFMIEQKLLQDRFLLDDGFIPWEILNNQKGAVNSTLDDLRIIRTLLTGDQLFSDPDAKSFALQIAKGLLKRNFKDGFLLDYASYDGKERAQTVQIRYLEPKTFFELSKYIPKYQEIYDKSMDILKQAEQPDGLYAAAYLPKQHAFLYKNGHIVVDTNMSEQLMTAIHSQASGISIDPMLSLLHSMLKDSHQLYATIHTDGNESTSGESPAVYALASILLERAGWQSDAQMSLKHLQNMQVASDRVKGTNINKERANLYRGGFVDLNTLQAYSFDQLTGLLAMREVGKRGNETK